MPKVGRTMLAEGGRPRTGREDGCLGVRVPADIPDAETAAPGQGGMSVFAQLKKLPGRLIPARLRDRYPQDLGKARGDDSLFVWCWGEGDFEDAVLTDLLCLRLDKPGEKRHRLIEPHKEIPMTEYEAALSATADEWRICEELP